MATRRKIFKEKRMRVELSSGEWIEIREKLSAGDKFAVQGAIEMTTENGKQTYSGGLANDMRNALLIRIITSWSYSGIPVPSQHIAGVHILGEVLSIDDYNELMTAIEPLMDKISGTPTKDPQKPTGN